MELEGAQLGTRVRVQLDYKEPQRQGAVGTIQKRYEVPESGGGSSGSSTRGTSEECTILDNQQAGRITQKEHNALLDVWREQVNQARGGQEACWSLAQDLAQQSADAYKDFLESVFFYYGENARAAEKGTRQG